MAALCRFGGVLVAAIIVLPAPVRADEPKLRTVEQLASELKPSIVVITVKGRDGADETLGTGFVVDGKGIIATNLHVIGEGRAITVQSSDGKKFDVKSIESIDRVHDLAVVKIDAKGLAPLTLGDSGKLKEGQSVLALGNPQGLTNSVVAGVVSGRREINGTSMIQLAMPFEPGNSGGPLVDLEGRVHGIITLKSIVTRNLGFAVPSSALKTLLAKPNPIPIQAWVTIGALDPDEWKTIMGAQWRQRAGRIKVDGAGSGFGGRSLCIYQPKPPELPYEVAVSVKLADESGAAGLAFLYDGERHFGFYPTGGKLRLTRFDGPDVFSWKILEERTSPHYRPGDWNSIKVRFEKDAIKCFVNDHLAIESKGIAWKTGQPGLAKFRDTAAEFKNFQVGTKIEPAVISTAEAARLLGPLKGLPLQKPVPLEVIARLAKQNRIDDILRDQARDLEQQAARLREIAVRVHERRTNDQLNKLLAEPEDKIDLVHASLLIAKLDNEEVDVDAYRAEFDRMARKLSTGLPPRADDNARLAALNAFFFEQRGFHGSRGDYYSRSNSYLNEVIDDREGLPITLSVLYMELGRRIGLKLAGVSMPGHFVVKRLKLEGKKDDRKEFIDVYERGALFDLKQAKQRIMDRGVEFRDELVEPVAKKAIVLRMLYNLLHVARDDNDMDAALRYLDGIVTLDSSAGDERHLRSVLLYAKGRKKEALEDVEYLLDHFPDRQDRERLLEMQRLLDRETAE